MKTNCAVDGEFIVSELSLEKIPENLPDVPLLILIAGATILVKRITGPIEKSEVSFPTLTSTERPCLVSSEQT